MKKYKVLIEGNNFLINLDDKIDKFGFFTTRFVEARDQEYAENLVIKLITDELHSSILNDCLDPPEIYAEEVYEINDFGDNIVPGSGFTWFKINEEGIEKSGTA